MGIEEDRIKSLERNHPEHIPVGVYMLPATFKRYREKLEEVMLRHPILFGEYDAGSRDFDDIRGTYAEGEHTDPARM